jgi:hypothetical protein
MKNNLFVLKIIVALLIIVTITAAKLSASNTSQLSKKKWETLTKDLNYQDDTKKEIIQKNGYNKKSTIKFPTFKINNTGQIVLIIIVIMVLIFLSKLIIKIKPNSTFENLTNIDEKIEDKLLESDIEMLLLNAKKAENWRLSIRIYYLMMLKKLHQFNYINWQKEKTNAQYKYELNNWILLSDWNEITQQYERVWYGENVLNEFDFLNQEIKIVRLLKSISTTLGHE